MVVAASRNHLYRRRLQVVIDAGPRNHLYLLGQQVKIRSSPRNHLNLRACKPLYAALRGGFCVCCHPAATLQDEDGVGRDGPDRRFRHQAGVPHHAVNNERRA